MIGVEYDKQPANRAESDIPVTGSAAAYRQEIESLMLKYKIFYTHEKTDTLNEGYQQHHAALMRVVVERAAGSSGVRELGWDSQSVFDLLHGHSVDVFKRDIIAFIQSVVDKVCIIQKNLRSVCTNPTSLLGYCRGRRSQ